MMWRIFSYTYLPSAILFDEVSVQVFCHFLIGLFIYFLVLSFKSSLHILNNNPFSDVSFFEHFLLDCRLFSHSLDMSFPGQNFNEVQLIDSFFPGSCLWC